MRRGNPITGSRRTRAAAFSIIELMVVIAIIAILMAILLPTLVNAQKNARKVECQSNLRVMGQMLIAYTNENNGWLFPVGPEGPDGRPTTLGTN